MKIKQVPIFITRQSEDEFVAYTAIKARPPDIWNLPESTMVC